MLKIHYGRESINREKFIYENVTGPAFILVPDQFTLEAEKAAFRYLKVESLMDVEIISMSRLGSRILKKCGGLQKDRLDRYGRHMLLSEILCEDGCSLDIFRNAGKKTAFIEMANDLISEMKQYNATPEKLDELAGELPKGSILSRKLSDVARIYKAYEDAIENRFIDTEDYLEVVRGKVQEYEPLSGAQVFIYGFDYFTPKNLDIIRELIKACRDVHVVLTYDPQGPEQLFGITGEVIRKLTDICRQLSLKYEESQIPSSYCYGSEEKTPEILHIEKNLYTYPGSRFSEEPENIYAIKAANPYAECESAASFVVRLTREEKLRYGDIAVICNDLSGMGSIIHRTFEEYGIPVFIDRRTDVLHNPVCSLNLCLLNLAAGRLDRENVIGLLKTGLTEADRSQVEELENYAITYQIRGNMWAREFKRGRKMDGKKGGVEPETLEEINKTRAYVYGLIKSFKQALSEREDARGKVYSIYSFLCDTLKLPERLELVIKEQISQGCLQLAAETSQIWKHVQEVYRQFALVMGERQVSAGFMLEILKSGFESGEMGVLPGSTDLVIVGNTQRTRVSRVKALLVLGARDGVLPVSKEGEGILSQREKELLYSRQGEICKRQQLKSMEEKLGIYRIFSSPSKYLYISTSVSDIEGDAQKPSPVYNRLLSLFPKLRQQRDALNLGQALAQMERRTPALRHLGEALEEHGPAELASPWKDALNWFYLKDHEGYDLLDMGMDFSLKNQGITQDEADILYGRDSVYGLSLSPSRVEKYSRCPFAHFVNYGLRPEERRIFQLASMEMGNIYHLCIMNLSKHLTKPGVPITDPASPWMSFTGDDVKAFVEKFMEEEGATSEGGILQYGELEKYKAERMKKICTYCAQILVNHVQQGSISQLLFEEAFNHRGDSRFPGVTVDTKAGKVLIEGRIDRVDILPGDYVKIIDYKSGSEKFSLSEAKAGYRLQLMLYLEGALGGVREGKPAGVFYFKLAEPDVNAKDFNREKLASGLQSEIEKVFKLDGIMVDRDEVINSIAGDIEAGSSSSVVSLQRKKDGEITGGKNFLLSYDDFMQVRTDVMEKVQKACENLALGRADIYPAKVKDQPQCTYCQYKGICKFDTSFEGCSYHRIK